MKLRTFKYDNKIMVGILKDNLVYPLPFNTMNDLIDSGKSTEEIKSLMKNAIKLEETEPMAPIPNPKQDIICVGINYKAHAEESARYEEKAFGGEHPHAVYFAKRATECVPNKGNVPSYSDLTKTLDYECELAVIISKDAKNISKEDAFDYVFGYTIINDISSRNLQSEHNQWYFGKSLDYLCPMGPDIVTEDEFDRPPKLTIQTHINGELRQNSNTGLLIHTIPDIISELSKGMTLKAGTIISTGTPDGVGMGFQPPKFLKKGDVIECHIEKIGNLINYIV